MKPESKWSEWAHCPGLPWDPPWKDEVRFQPKESFYAGEFWALFQEALESPDSMLSKEEKARAVTGLCWERTKAVCLRGEEIKIAFTVPEEEAPVTDTSDLSRLSLGGLDVLLGKACGKKQPGVLPSPWLLSLQPHSFLCVYRQRAQDLQIRSSNEDGVYAVPCSRQLGALGRLSCWHCLTFRGKDCSWQGSLYTPRSPVAPIYTCADTPRTPHLNYFAL